MDVIMLLMVVWAVVVVVEVEVDSSTKETTSNILTCNPLMKYSGTSLVEKIHLLVSLMMMMTFSVDNLEVDNLVVVDSTNLGK